MPEVRKNRLRVRKVSPKGCLEYGTHDVGEKGGLQRLACRKRSGWKTQSWILNLKDYPEKKVVFMQLNTLYKRKEISKRDLLKSKTLVNKWWRKKK